MPRQEWYLGLAGYLGMWMTMMLPMMLPSLVPMVSRYRRALAAGAERPPGPHGVVGHCYMAV